MRRTLAVLATSALLASGCTTDEEPAKDPGPVTVTLTGDERDDFLERVVDLGFTCREALPETAQYVACTRPGAYPEAIEDTVHVTSSEDGEQVLRVRYCGPETGVTPAFSDAFLDEVGSPDLRAEPPALEGLTFQECRSTSGEGFRVGGPGVQVLRELDLDLLRQSLRQRGWSCQDDEAAYCTRPVSRGGRQVVWGVPGEVRVVAPTARELAAAARALALSPIVAEAAASCLPETVCDHLLVDGFDLFFDADADYHRIRVRERRDF